MAHGYWKAIVQPSDTVIDATCGNGHDTLFLSQLASEGRVIAIDIQATAIENTRKLLAGRHVELIHGSHATFPDDIALGSVRLIVHNLGYLPGGDKQITTRVETTLASVTAAQRLLMPQGVLSITCYPGHPQGLVEEEALIAWAAGLNAKEWSCCHHRWLNRRSAPSLLLIQKCNF